MKRKVLAFLSTVTLTSLLSYTVPAYARIDAGGSNPLPTMMNEEINFLLDHAQGDPDKITREQTINAIDFLNQINSKHHHYEVIRINAFIPVKTIPDPRPFHNDLFHGDNRGFDVNALSSRTSQEFIVDLNTHQVKVVDYVGETIEYDKNGKVLKSARADTSGMHFTVDSSNDVIHIHAFEDVGNPLGDFFAWKAPPIEYDIDFNILTNGSATAYAGDTKRFPAYEVYARTDNHEWKVMDRFYPNLNFWPNPTDQLFKVWGGMNYFESVLRF
ncbi:hypothetical protein DNHGIG_40460 [Collibacillus ludicampi]|uniref:Uncharacterized protein n=1 Tax=Collibacillus ludicampi TaxID=2771369 RepID=A0AAV4LL35_9BACL|nr:hypothetical protein [Collibacillus ludicampi]GIM48497.1 hypothetical protein DNHGIG_40460 [Collibacillus ludicampi]